MNKSKKKIKKFNSLKKKIKILLKYYNKKILILILEKLKIIN